MKTIFKPNLRLLFGMRYMHNLKNGPNTQNTSASPDFPFWKNAIIAKRTDLNVNTEFYK